MSHLKIYHTIWRDIKKTAIFIATNLRTLFLVRQGCSLCGLTYLQNYTRPLVRCKQLGTASP